MWIVKSGTMNKDDKQIIYEIYRACRLCGAGAGYKMPIIQSVIDLEGEDIELKQKIRECVQIEVNHNDRMPPLICELCVDKINDFFEFRKMCQDTNKNTRMRLGLPIEQPIPILPKLEINDSILGMSEPVYIYSDSDEGEPLSKQQSTPTLKSKPNPKSAKPKKESEVKVENTQPIINEKVRSPSPEPERRETRRKRAPSPKRSSRRRNSDDESLSELRTPNRMEEMDGMSLLVPRSKRPREILLELPPTTKKAKPSPVPPIPENISKPGPKSSKVAPKPPAPQKEAKPPPRAGPKSRMQSLSPAPTPKAKKAEVTPSQALKSKKKEASPALAPKFSKELAALLGQAIKPKKAEMTPAPGPKSKKVEIVPAPGPKSKKAEITPAPGPKSRKAEIMPAPGPKSKKAEIMPAPGPKSKKAEIMPAPGPKSKKVEVNSTLEPKKDELRHTPGPKSRRREISPATTSKSKKSSREPSPSPSRGKKREASPQTPSRASPVPAKITDCNICGWKAKTPQGFVSHLKSHTPSFTAIRLSCNACELWFYTLDEANWHHRRHANKSLPYTCNKCYDDFRTTDDYEMHFTRNQCLPTYEVPDVKCDECWRYFATYKLLEDHKCPGEGGRPGGQCSKCNKTYSLLKHQIVHEMKCNVKKKGEPVVDPDVNSKLLQMEVRIVKCDLLLKNPVNERYDVSALSNRFGLDRNRSYPYLNSPGDVRVKSEPSTTRFDHMVSIQDDIKEEYLKDDDSYVHWDSDGSTDSNDTMDSVDTLSKMSLKTIFSPKYLGKVPRKKRKIKSEGTCESPLSIDFNGSLSTNIDNIISDLGNETSASGKCDSDSVVNKCSIKNTDSSLALDVLDGLKTDKTVSRKDENKNIDDPVKESDETDSDKIRNSVDTKCDENEIKIATDSNTNLDEAVNSDSLVHSDDTFALQSTNKDKLVNDSKNFHLVGNNVVNDNESLHKEDEIDLNISIESGKVEVDDKLKNNDVVKDKEVVNTTETISNLHNVSRDENEKSVLNNYNHEIDANSENSQSSDVMNFKAIDVTNEVNEGSQSSVVTNDKTDSDFTKIDSDNTTDSQLSLTKSTIEKSDDKQDEPAKGIGFQEVTENDSVEKDVQCADKFNINNLNADDKRLMAELDAHIGENKSNRNDDSVIQGGVIGASVTNEQSEHAAPVIGDSKSAVFETKNPPSAVNSDIGFDNCEDKKESLEDMMQKRDADLRSLDLDSISDEEFNFDI